MSVYYRFLHERLDSYRAIELNMSSVRTSDLKMLVAEHAGLEKEYMRLFDLKVFDNDEKEAFPDDKLLPIYSRVVIQRIPWRELKEIHHEAQRSIQDGEETETTKETKLTLPSEYICKLCKFPLLNPVLIKCAGSCGASACRDCVKNYLEQNKTVAVKPCPSCGQRFRGSVPNKSLSNMLATIDWEKFNYPVRNPEVKAPDDAKGDGLVKLQDPGFAGEVLAPCSASGTKLDPDSEEVKACPDGNALARDASPEPSPGHASLAESAQQQDVCLPESSESASALPQPQASAPDQLSRCEGGAALVSALSPADEAMSSSLGIAAATNASLPPAEWKPLSSATAAHITEQSGTDVLTATIAKAAPPPFPGVPASTLPPHIAPPHQLPPHPAAMHAAPYVDPWNMQGHPYPVYTPDGAPRFHPVYPGAAPPFSQPGPVHHPYGYVMQPPGMMNPGVYGGAHPSFPPPPETILPICGPYLTEEQQIQLAMSFPMLSEESFELIKLAQQSVKDIWQMLPKSVRSSLFQETQDLGGSQAEKKGKPFKKRKDYNVQSSVISTDGVNLGNNSSNSSGSSSSSSSSSGNNAAGGSAYSCVKHPSLKKRPIS